MENVMSSKKIELIREFMSTGQDEEVVQDDWAGFLVDDAVIEVIHESEFVKYICERIESTLNIYDFDINFLERATGVSKNVFESLKKECFENTYSQAVASIIANTKGVIETAKLALYYYGINHFFGLSGRREPDYKTDDGFCLWVVN
ncbi:hypothetical protein [Virgibacillus proomii]|uniref:hypothetical protein n=1 Tax=Virgibacillus proomii TaxID=84407 RepID=UPI001C11434A|nr:hypothetical protein [Virgibacillus proomii]MBU5265724.1 hypothetical protein [Virgibacillus proomii]